MCPPSRSHNNMSQLTSPRAVVLPAAEELNHAALDAPNGLEDMNEIVAEPSAQPTLSCVELQSSEVNAAQKISPPVLRVPPVAMQRAASVNIAKAAASPPGISARPRLLRRQETSSMLKEARLKRFNERHGIATAMELQRQVTQHRAWILESQVKQQAFWGRVPVLIPAKHPLLGRWDAVTTLALIYVRERRSSRRPYTRGRAASCDPPPPHVSNPRLARLWRVRRTHTHMTAESVRLLLRPLISTRPGTHYVLTDGDGHPIRDFIRAACHWYCIVDGCVVHHQPGA